MYCRYQPRTAIFIGLCFLFYSLASISLSRADSTTNQWHWSNVDRIIVVPDVHGAFTELRTLLIASGVIDDSLKWIGGKTHLVSLGDLLDRGPESRKVMDLLMRLQSEATEQGGRVHVLAGNHEIMNLMGDLRYVSVGEFAAYDDSAPMPERERAYDGFLADRSERIALNFLGGGVITAERSEKNRLKFEDLYPPGYFGKRAAFAPTGHYGRWLLTLPAVIVINQTAFVHGGLSPMTSTMSPQKINQKLKEDLNYYFQLLRQLIDADVFPETSTSSTPTLAREALRIADPSSCMRQDRAECKRERSAARYEQRELKPEDLQLLKEFVELTNSSMLGVDGPLWYRGTVRCKDILESPILDAALEKLQANRVVVGHTPTVDRRVHLTRDNKVIMLDTGMLVSRYKGRPAALVIEDDAMQVQYLNPSERTDLLGDIGNIAYPLATDQLQEALEFGNITEVQQPWFDRHWKVALLYQGIPLQAIFYPDDQRESANLELAAFGLDRLLGLGIVPLTVERTINDQHGAIQLAIPGLITEAARLRKGLDIGGWCPMQPQYDLMNAYDLLIDNSGRSNPTFGYDPRHWSLYVTGHERAFSTSRTLPDPSHYGEFSLLPGMANALSKLDEHKLAVALGRWLDQDQRAAILARRDVMLARDQQATEKKTR
jgi:Calcineurin-like phosphoesterase